MKSLKLLAAGGLIAALSLHAAHATPTITYKLLLDGSQVATGTSSTGFLSASISNSLFSQASLTILGVPQVPSPDLNTTTLALTSATGFSGSHTLQLFVTQTGLVSPTGMIGLGNTLNLNNLIGSVNSSVSNYVNADNSLYGTTTLMATLTGAPGGNVASDTVANVNVGAGPYSETEVLSSTFTAPSQDLNTNDQIAYVPEPASLALVGAGLFGLGLIRRRRNQASGNQASAHTA